VLGEERAMSSTNSIDGCGGGKMFSIARKRKKKGKNTQRSDYSIPPYGRRKTPSLEALKEGRKEGGASHRFSVLPETLRIDPKFHARSIPRSSAVCTKREGKEILPSLAVAALLSREVRRKEEKEEAGPPPAKPGRAYKGMLFPTLSRGKKPGVSPKISLA